MEAFTSFITKDWYISIPMFLMMLVAAILTIWRFMLNLNIGSKMDDFWPEFQDILQRKGVPAAIRFCETETGVIPTTVLVAGLETAKQGLAAMKRSMAAAIELEVAPRLQFLLAPILAIAKIATMVGLLGTVISMIQTFNEIASASQNATEVTKQAKSIGLALFATALGLMTAIPLVFAHVLFKDWIHRFEIKIKASAQRFLVLFQNAKPKLESDPDDKDEEGDNRKSKKRQHSGQDRNPRRDPRT